MAVEEGAAETGRAVTGCIDCARTTAGTCVVHPAVVLDPERPVVVHLTPMLQGWQCPQCRACFSPYTSACQYCGPQSFTATTSIATAPYPQSGDDDVTA